MSILQLCTPAVLCLHKNYLLSSYEGEHCLAVLPKFDLILVLDVEGLWKKSRRNGGIVGDCSMDCQVDMKAQMTAEDRVAQYPNQVGKNALC